MLIEHLRNELHCRTLKNPKYSLRAFAKSLDIDPSTLSALLKKKRPLTAKTANKLIVALDVDDPTVRREIFARSFEKGESLPPKYTDFELEKFELISSWEHFAILSYLELTDRKATLRSIARSLGIPGQTAADALARLEKSKLIVEHQGRWTLTGANMAAISKAPSSALKRNNRQYIELSLASLEKDSIDDRDITGVTMAINKSKLPEAKAMIKEFRRKLAAFLETDERNAVYRINIQLFPLTREETP